jgi:endonuclease/exonuclease/phosphatase family metal-dependent hydrolase
MMRWTIRILKFLSTVLLVLMTVSSCVRYEWMQYAVALATGYARPLPAPETHAVQARGGSAPCAGGPIRVITYNIFNGSALMERMVDRFGEGNIQGFKQWSVRVPEIRERIASYDADLIGLQETGWNHDIAAIVPEDAGYTLLTCKVGALEYGDSAMLFRTERFALLDNGQFWYGPKPDLPLSYGFKKLSMLRYCNWAVLREKTTGFTFLWANTHFDNASVNKEPGAQVYRERIASLAGAMPVIATGDFNTTGDTERYRVLSGYGALKDTQSLAETKLVHESHGHSPREITEADVELDYMRRIDHILVGGPCDVKVEKWLIDTRPLKDSAAISDHDLMMARISFGEETKAEQVSQGGASPPF